MANEGHKVNRWQVLPEQIEDENIFFIGLGPGFQNLAVFAIKNQLLPLNLNGILNISIQ